MSNDNNKSKFKSDNVRNIKVEDTTKDSKSNSSLNIVLCSVSLFPDQYTPLNLKFDNNPINKELKVTPVKNNITTSSELNPKLSTIADINNINNYYYNTECISKDPKTNTDTFFIDSSNKLKKEFLKEQKNPLRKLLSIQPSNSRKKGLQSLSNNIFGYMSEFYDTIDLFSLGKINKKFFNKVTNKDVYRMVVSIVKNQRTLEYLISNDGMMMAYYLERLNLEEDSIQANKFIEFVITICLKDKVHELKINKNIGPKGFNFLCLSNNLHVFSTIDLATNKISDDGAIRLSQIIPWLPRLEKLNLSMNQFSTKGVKILFEALSIHLTIKELNISGNNGFAEGMEAVESFLKKNRSIKILNISYNTIQDKGIISIAEGLLFSKSLTSIDLSSNKITFEGAIALSEIFNKDNYMKIESLNISSHYFKEKAKTTENTENSITNTQVDESVSGKPTFFTTNFFKEPQQSTIDSNIAQSKMLIDRLSPTKNEQMPVQSILKKQPTSSKYMLYNIEEESEELDIHNNQSENNLPNQQNLGATGLSPIKQIDNSSLFLLKDSKINFNLSSIDSLKLPEIDKLKHSNSSFPDQQQINKRNTCFEFDISKRKYSTIEKLNLSSNKIESQGCIAILRRLSEIGVVKSIFELNLSSCSLSYLIFNDLYLFLSKTLSLKVLIMKQNNFSRLDSNLLFNCIAENSTLQKLQLDSCNLSEECVESLFKAISSTEIDEIHLGNNDVTPESCSTIAKYLNTSCLKRLIIPNNRIGDDGLAKISSSLIMNTKLEKLNISMNELTDEGIIQFISILKAKNEMNVKLASSINKLQEIDLSVNDLSDEASKEIFSYIAFNDNNIEYLNLAGNCITADSVEDICVAINYSNHLKKIDLCENQIDSQGLKKIINSCAISSSMEYIDISKNNNTRNMNARRYNNIENTELKDIANELLLNKPTFKIIY